MHASRASNRVMRWGPSHGVSKTSGHFVNHQISEVTTIHITSSHLLPGASFQLFLGGGRNFFWFFSATGLLKNWKKQHFICSNLTLFIVPFFLFSLFFSFLSLFSFFLSFFSFFSFFFSSGGDGPPAPLNDASAYCFHQLGVWGSVNPQTPPIESSLRSTLLLTEYIKIWTWQCYSQGRHFNFFLGGQNFFKFFNATGLVKNWKKQHFICSNLTLFIVPFFLFSLFFLFSFSFFFFSFFYSFSLGGEGALADGREETYNLQQSPSHHISIIVISNVIIYWQSWWKQFMACCDMNHASVTACCTMQCTIVAQKIKVVQMIRTFCKQTLSARIIIILKRTKTCNSDQ